MLISVIIPVYNGEKYLRECIDSVCACASTEIECILVNDGSTDGSRTICEDAVSRDARLRLINKDNSGVSDSRNTGVSAAHGKYIFFLDADDYIDADRWPQIVACAGESDADLIVFGYYSLFSTGYKQEERFPFEGGMSTSPADIYFALLASPMLNTCWGKLLRRRVIEEHGLRFDTKLVTCEDAVFMIECVNKASTFLLCNICILNYRIHDTSVMRQRPLEDKLRDFAVLYERRRVFLDAHQTPGLHKALFRECFSVLTNFLLEYAVDHSLSEMQAICKILLDHPAAHDILTHMDPHDIKPFFKRFEHAWMRRRRILPLSLYFHAKSRFKSKH